MSLLDRLQNLEALSRLGISPAAGVRLQQCLEGPFSEQELFDHLEACPLIHMLLLQLASTSYYAGQRPVLSVAMAWHGLGEQMGRTYLSGLLHSLPQREEPEAVRSLRQRLAAARRRILESSGQGDPALLGCLCRLFELVPLQRSLTQPRPETGDWRTWGRELEALVGGASLSPRLHESLQHLDRDPADCQDLEEARNRALLQLILCGACGCDTGELGAGIWGLVELHPHLMQNPVAEEPNG